MDVKLLPTNLTDGPSTPACKRSSRHQIEASLSHDRGFTISELLVVVAVLAVLIGLVLPGMSHMRAAARRTTEISAARQLMVGFLAYATDHQGRVLPGYHPEPTLRAEDESGSNMYDLGPVGARYPWRLAPYLDYDVRGLYVDRWVLSGFEDATNYPYLVSLYPSMGMNGTFIGGDGSAEGLGFNDLYSNIFGSFYITRLADARHPQRLITFASARIDLDDGSDATPVVEGYFIVRPPYLNERKWTDAYPVDVTSDSDRAADWGYVSLRHRRKAVTAMLDGSTATLGEGELLDMRRWSDAASMPDWTLQPRD